MSYYWEEAEKHKPKNYEHTPCSVYDVTNYAELRYYKGKLQQKVRAEYRYDRDVHWCGMLTNHIPVYFWVNIPEIEDEEIENKH
jgi:hypothetical protein